jgi:hypothetical protein
LFCVSSLFLSLILSFIVPSFVSVCLPICSCFQLCLSSVLPFLYISIFVFLTYIYPEYRIMTFALTFFLMPKVFPLRLWASRVPSWCNASPSRQRSHTQSYIWYSLMLVLSTLSREATSVTLNCHNVNLLGRPTYWLHKKKVAPMFVRWSTM